MKISKGTYDNRLNAAFHKGWEEGKAAGVVKGIEEGKKQERAANAARVLETRTRLLDAIARSTDAAAHALMSFDNNL